MTTLTPERIAELRQLRDAATPGKWELEDGCDGDGAMIYSGPPISENIACMLNHSPGIDDEKDAEWIVAACNELPAALDEIERLRAQVEKMRAALAPFANIATWQDRHYRKPSDDQEISIEAISRDCARIFSTVRLLRDFRAAAEAMK